jgi:hypothetical protein
MSGEFQTIRSAQFSDGTTLDAEPNWACGSALQASSGIAMGLLLGAGTWMLLGGFAFIVFVNFKAFLS